MLCDDTTGRHWAKLSNGDGTFKDLGNYLNGWCGHKGSKTSWADIDGDGKADILCDDKSGRHWARLSNGDGKWKKDLGNYLNGWCGHKGATTSWADINGDGMADIICDDTAGRHWARLSAGNGKWIKDLANFLNGWCGHKGAKTNWADIDADGKADILCDDTSGRHWARLSNGDGTWKADLKNFKKGWCGHGGSLTSWADMDGDGNADLLCDDAKGRHWAILNKPGAFGLFAKKAAPAPAPKPAPKPVNVSKPAPPVYQPFMGEKYLGCFED